jgi:geranylgeranyl transferase type-2 subunit beta
MTAPPPSSNKSTPSNSNNNNNKRPFDPTRPPRPVHRPNEPHASSYTLNAFPPGQHTFRPQYEAGKSAYENHQTVIRAALQMHAESPMACISDLEQYLEYLNKQVHLLTLRTRDNDEEIAQLIMRRNEMRNPNAFKADKHQTFLHKAHLDRESPMYVLSEHIRLQSMFWCIGALQLLGDDSLCTTDTVRFVLSCFDPVTGGFGPAPRHDAHLLHTQHAIYILAQCDALGELDLMEGGGVPSLRDQIATYISSLQASDGSFMGDYWGEKDLRYIYCAVAALAVLDRLDWIDIDKTAQYICSMRNVLDGGFGSDYGVESHAGYIFTAVGALSIMGKLHAIQDWDTLAWWLCERQCDSGGLNGRPEKLADVCYSWWVLSALWIIGRLDWIDKQKCIQFILRCEDPDTGGIADHPDNVGDVYHTFFGICGLSLLGYFDPRHDGIDPVFALPKSVMEKIGLKSGERLVVGGGGGGIMVVVVGDGNGGERKKISAYI